MKSTMLCEPLLTDMPLEMLEEEVFEMTCEYPRWRIRVAVMVVEATGDVIAAIKASWRKKRGRRFLVVVSDDLDEAVREMWALLLAA